jgi:hypothetical protein
MMAWLMANYGLVLAFVVALDQILAAIPSVKANSTFQLIAGWVAALVKPTP